MTLPYVLEWPVDQHGYALEQDNQHWWITARGGSPHFYRPMEHGGLWRRFADQCSNAGADRSGWTVISDDHEGILAFVSEFGLLEAPPLSRWEVPLEPSARQYPIAVKSELVPVIGGKAKLMHQIAQHLDNGRRGDAADLFRFAQPKLTAGVSALTKAGKFELEFIPASLSEALFLQVAEAITGNYEWRRCRNVGCPEWLRVGGSGGVTQRREFCSTRCRVADARRKGKQQ